MANDNRPNLFSYATSELSQDAFICWLAAWAKPEYKSVDENLHQTACSFLVSMIHKVNPSFKPLIIKTIDVKQQYPIKYLGKPGRVDILINLTYTNSIESETKTVIIIEDKIDAGLTGNQLKIYANAIDEDERFINYEKYFILLKTGYYDTKIKDHRFEFFNRKDFLNVLESYDGKNAIILDYRYYIQAIDQKLNRFKQEPVPEQDPISQEDKQKNRYYWIGLHTWLLESEESNLLIGKDAGYGYVNNASGGFNGFWWNFEGYRQDNYWSYMQLENDKLCYKIGFSEEMYKTIDWETEAQNVKSLWSKTLSKFGKELSKKGIRIGRTMTVAKIGDILCIKNDGILDLAKTVEKLVEAQEILRRTRLEINLTNQV